MADLTESVATRVRPGTMARIATILREREVPADFFRECIEQGLQMKPRSRRSGAKSGCATSQR